MPRSDFPKPRAFFNALEVVALRRAIPKHPERPLSYLPVVLSVVILRVVPCLAMAYFAIEARGVAQLGVTLLALAIFVPMAAIHAFGLFLAIKHREELLHHMPPTGCERS
jgi:hypothetical protein